MGYFEIGKIANTQGLRGEVRVLPTTDDPSRFGLLDEVDVFLHGISRTLQIERVRYYKQLVVLKFRGLDTIEDVLPLKNGVIRIPEEKALPLGEDEYYIRDLYGMSVVTENGERVGEITDVMFTGANDVYAVTGTDGKETLIPAVKDFVLKVDVKGREMTVKIPR